jgi:hypothetical protein
VERDGFHNVFDGIGAAIHHSARRDAPAEPDRDDAAMRDLVDAMEMRGLIGILHWRHKACRDRDENARAYDEYGGETYWQPGMECDEPQ